MTSRIPHRVDDIRTQLGDLVPPGRSDASVADSWARAIWSLITEPGDGVAGQLVASLGANAALEEIQKHSASSRRVPRSLPLAQGLARWLPRWDAGQIDGMFRTARLAGLRVVTPDDQEWPRGLFDLGVHAPHMLWVRGAGLAALSRTPRIALVGARAASGYGDLVARDLAAALVIRGAGVISGAAYGIDGAAHQAALGAGGLTVAVLAGGVDRPYPSGHSELIGRIATGGAVIGEVAPGAAPTKSRFLQRNRVIAAISDATVVVEAGWRSGSLNTAGHAASLGRPLGAVPGPITSTTSAGCHRLLREFDATCVTSGAEVWELVEWGWGARGDVAALGTAEATPVPRGQLLEGLTGRVARPVNELARQAGLPLPDVEAQLGILELEGRVVRDGDGGWRRAPAGKDPR